MTTWVHTSTLWHTLLNGFIKLDQIRICSKHHLCPAFNDQFSPECWISGLSIYLCWADLAFSNAWQWYFSHVLFLRSLLFFFFLSVPPTACGILVPQPGIEPKSLVVEARSLNHWTTRKEVSLSLFFLYSFLAQVITNLCHNHPQEFTSCSNGRLSPWALPLETDIPGNRDPRVPSKKLCKGTLFRCWLSMRLKIQ